MAKGSYRVAEALKRTVVTEQDAANLDNGLPNVEDDYKTKLLKYIPVETVAFYTGTIGVVETLKATSPTWYAAGLVLVFLIGLVGTIFLLNRVYGITWKYKKRQIIVSTASYVLWVLSLGSFQGWLFIPPVFVTLLLGAFTFLVPIFVDPGTNTSKQPT